MYSDKDDNKKEQLLNIIQFFKQTKKDLNFKVSDNKLKIHAKLLFL